MGGGRRRGGRRRRLGFGLDRCGLGFRLGLDLLHDVSGAPDTPEPAVRTTIDIAGRWIVPGVDADSSRVVTPGIPERSALFYRMLSRRPSSQMPPLGTVIPDELCFAGRDPESS